MKTVGVMAVGVPIVIVALLVLVAWAFYVYKFRYKTVLSNEVLVITGTNLKGENVYTDTNGRSVMIQRGGGYRLRMFQTARKASLHSFQIKLSTPTVYVKHGIPIVADAVATVKVADELENIVKYAEQYMGKEKDEIEDEISNVLNSNLRAILSKLSVEEINNDRESFSRQVQHIAQVELLNMGFSITAFGLEDIRDAHVDGYLKNLGRPKLAEMRETAEKAESDAERSIRIHRAENDKQSTEEELKRAMEIAEIEKEKELLVQKNLAETGRETAITEQAYELEKVGREKQIEQERLHIELLKKQERLKQEEIDRKNAVIRAEREADEMRIRSEAEKLRQIAEGEAIAQTLREKERAQYEILRERGRAEAEVIREKGQAEAEAKRLMAEAIREYGEVAILELLIEAMPQMAEQFAKAYENVDEIKIVDLGQGDGAASNRLTKSVVQNMTGIQAALEETTGLNVKQLIETFVAKGRNKMPNERPERDELLHGEGVNKMFTDEVQRANSHEENEAES